MQSQAVRGCDSYSHILQVSHGVLESVVCVYRHVVNILTEISNRCFASDIHVSELKIPSFYRNLLTPFRPSPESRSAGWRSRR